MGGETLSFARAAIKRVFLILRRKSATSPGVSVVNATCSTRRPGLSSPADGVRGTARALEGLLLALTLFLSFPSSLPCVCGRPKEKHQILTRNHAGDTRRRDRGLRRQSAVKRLVGLRVCLQVEQLLLWCVALFLFACSVVAPVRLTLYYYSVETRMLWCPASELTTLAPGSKWCKRQGSQCKRSQLKQRTHPLHCRRFLFPIEHLSSDHTIPSPSEKNHQHSSRPKHVAQPRERQRYMSNKSHGLPTLAPFFCVPLTDRGEGRRRRRRRRRRHRRRGAPRHQPAPASRGEAARQESPGRGEVLC